MFVSTHLIAALVTPALLWGGLGAMAAPVLIHLLARRRFRRVRWAATAFLLAAQRQNRRRVRLEQLILLALRCLAMGLIGLLLARPFAAPGSWVAALGTTQRTERIFVLDDSFSMAAKLDRGTAFDRARDMLIDALELVHGEAPDDPVTIRRTSTPRSPLVSGSLLDAVRLTDLRERLKRIDVSQTADVHKAFIETARSMKDSRDVSNAVLYIISDFQRKDWAPTREPARTVSPLESFNERANQQRGLTVVMLPVGGPAPANLAVTGLQPAQPRLVAGVTGRIEAGITNFGDSTIRDVQVRAFLDDAALPKPPRISLGPGETALVPIEVMASDPGSHRVLVEIEPDGLDMDNSRRLALTAADALHVLILDGEPASDALRDEVALLATALRPEGPVASGNDVRVADGVEFAEADLDVYDIVVLANVLRLDADTLARLEDYASGGGGVVFFLGDRIEPDLYNDLFHRQGHGVFPLQLNHPVRVEPGRVGASLVLVDETHPLTRVFVGNGNPFLRQVHFQQYVHATTGREHHKEQGSAFESEDAPADERPAAAAGVHVLLRYGDDSAAPALVDSSFGRGRVLVFTSSCDQEWNDWALSPSYVVTALEMVQYVARPADEPQQVLVGSPIRFALDPGAFELTASLILPGESRPPSVTVQALGVPGEDGLQMTWEQTDRSGIYTFVLTDRSGRKRELPVPANLDPRESDLARCGREELARICATVTEDYSFGAGAANGDIRSAGRREFWPLMLIVLVGVLMTEHALAWWFGTRS